LARRKRVGLSELALAMDADFVDDDEDHEEDDQQRAKEDPGREDDVILADGDAGRGMDRTKHRDEIFGHRDILAEVYGTKERNNVIADGGVVGGRKVAKKVDHIVVGLTVEAHVAEEDDDVASYFAVNVNAAEETNSVVDRCVGRDVNVVEELDSILLGAGRRGGNREGGSKQANCEKSPMHRCPIVDALVPDALDAGYKPIYANGGAEVPG
jgi:hypothetical protein